MTPRNIIRTAAIALLLSSITCIAQTSMEVAPAAFGEFANIAAVVTQQPEWKNENGQSVARMSLRDADSAAWVLNFRSLNLPHGARMFVYGSDAVTGALVSLHGPYEGRGPVNVSEFSTAIVNGATLTIEIRSAARFEAWPFELESAERISAARLAELRQMGVQVAARVEPLIRKGNPNPEVRSTWVGDRLMQYEMVDGDAIAEGDMIITDSLPGSNSKSNRRDGTIVTNSLRLWAGGRMPFVFSDIMPADRRLKIEAAIAHWNSLFPGILVARTNQTNYVSFNPSVSSCSSSIGRVGGEQAIEFGPDCSTGNAIHEIAHALGMEHEQSRPDRNQFVRVNLANVEAGKELNFEIAAGTTGDGAYDFGSVMHYSRFAFSSNGLSTLDPLVPIPAGVVMGQRDGLSTGDANSVRKLYCSAGITNGPTSFELGPVADTISFNFTAAPYCKWTVTSSASWLKILSKPSGTGSGTITFSVTTTSFPHRTAYIRYNGEATAVRQSLIEQY